MLVRVSSTPPSPDTSPVVCYFLFTFPRSFGSRPHCPLLFGGRNSSRNSQYSPLTLLHEYCSYIAALAASFSCKHRPLSSQVYIFLYIFIHFSSFFFIFALIFFSSQISFLFHHTQYLLPICFPSIIHPSYLLFLFSRHYHSTFTFSPSPSTHPGVN